jgi:hypothetical protein
MKVMWMSFVLRSVLVILGAAKEMWWLENGKRSLEKK